MHRHPHSSKNNVEARARAIKRNGLSLVAIHHPLLRAGRDFFHAVASRRAAAARPREAPAVQVDAKDGLRRQPMMKNETSEGWRARQDSNLWPTAPEAVALSS